MVLKLYLFYREVDYQNLKKSLPVLIETINIIRNHSNFKIHVLFYILPHFKKIL